MYNYIKDIKTSIGITLRGLDKHDMQNYKVNGRDDFGNGTDTPYKRTFLICRILNFFKYLLNRIKQDLIYLINKYI